MGADSYGSGGWGFVSVRLEVAVCLEDLWAAFLLMGGAVIPPGLLFGLGLLSTDEGARFSQNGHLQRNTH